MDHPYSGPLLPSFNSATTLGKRARPVSVNSQVSATTPTTPTTPTSSKRARLDLQASKDRIEGKPSSTFLLLQGYLKRGIVPMLASSRHDRFDWENATNVAVTLQHAQSKSVLRALKSLIKSGRKYKGTTPGITVGDAGEGAIRYEYWPVFDECADEHDRMQYDRLRGVHASKPMSVATVAELEEYFYRPAHIPETVDI